MPRPPLHARRRHLSPAGSAAVGGPGAAPPWRQDRYLLMFVGGADDLAGGDAALDLGGLASLCFKRNEGGK